ncbi:hypothetical protein [Ralstonia pseudosolanacearum]|uniref:hypothetical protein n=1 Tax=Ralstonia pseudosolanacearum TaxID=1310165 RepID=UPI003CF22CFB
MPVGSVQMVVICSTAAGTGTVATNDGGRVSCGTDASGNAMYLSTVQAYVVDPSSASSLEAATQPFDYMQAAGFWGLAFTTIISLWLVSHGAGAIVNFLRRA